MQAGYITARAATVEGTATHGITLALMSSPVWQTVFSVDTMVDEAIRTNGYTFAEDSQRFG